MSLNNCFNEVGEKGRSIILSRHALHTEKLRHICNNYLSSYVSFTKKRDNTANGKNKRETDRQTKRDGERERDEYIYSERERERVLRRL